MSNQPMPPTDARPADADAALFLEDLISSLKFGHEFATNRDTLLWLAQLAQEALALREAIVLALPGPRNVLRGSYGCLTDDCWAWNDGTCKDGKPCLIGRVLDAARREGDHAR